MSVVGGGDIPKPSSEHAALILGNLWPEQSESAWKAFATALQGEGVRLFQEAEGPQKEIYRLVATNQEGAFIDAAVGLIDRRSATLQIRYEAYKYASTAANGVASHIWATKLRMAESVAAAEAKITAAKNELEPQIETAQAIGNGLAASQLQGELTARTTTAITQAQDEVATAAATGAGEITAQQAGITSSPGETGGSTAAKPMSTGTGTGARRARTGIPRRRCTRAKRRPLHHFQRRSRYYRRRYRTPIEQAHAHKQ